MTDIEKALTFFQGLSSGDALLATRYIDAERYVEHDPRIGDGVEGVRSYVAAVRADGAAVKVIRAFQDGAYIVTQADGHVRGDSTFFDVFRFEDGVIAEHWGFAAPAGPPNKSGHTQVDGPTEPARVADTDRNKAFVRDYYQTFHIEGRHDLAPRYFAGSPMIRHEPGVADGVDAFLRDLHVLTLDRTIDKIELLLGRGDLVFIVAGGTHRGDPCAYIDLYRVEDGRIMEHWGFPQAIPQAGKRQNLDEML